ncbi:hypothetical protein [uncultured Bacteroides sp.]|uniref:hypothetical protein n=1 Tax=uncultured Bacteroides sp. TaxID=162156 RepID=UPI00258C424C|nr:hypothetical protein [uncultured Bacteroides sp.]
MRKLFQCLFLLSAVVLAGSMWSCSDDDDQPGTNGEDSTLGVEAPASDAVFATSATFKLSTKGAESYVYKVVEGANAAEPDPVVVYAEAQENGTIVAVTGDTDEALVAGLEGNKTYTVFFIFKVGNEYKIYSQKINTPKYSQMVTVIKTDLFSVTLHVEVPEDVYYSLGFISIEDYETYKMQYGKTDADYVVANPYGGMRDPRYKGPQNITIENGVNAYAGALNEKDYEDDIYPYAVHPGTGYVIFIGQCNEDGTSEGFVNYIDNGGSDDDDWGVLGSKLPNIKEYTEEKPISENMEFTGRYAKTVLFTQAPHKGTGSVMAQIDRATEKSVMITYTPSDDILQYVVALIDDADLEMFLNFVGGEDGLQISVLNGGDRYDGVQQLTYSLTPGHTYTAYIVGVYNEDATIQTMDKLEGIKTIVSDKPAVEFKVTPLNMESPYQIGYNIKAPNGDCAAFKYLLNYTKDWYPELNGMEGENLEENIARMVATYGQGINDADVLSKINSAEGYDMAFSTMDDTESWLVLESYNVDEKTKLFYDGDNYRTTSAPLKAEEPVNSELFSKLQGTWTATMTNAAGTTVTCPVTIASGPEQVATLPEDVKQGLVEYFVKQGKTQAQAEELVLKYFEEYKEGAAYYTQKYKNMNCLVATGFAYDDWYAPLATSWDLFHSTEYSAYNTDELFRDYGPKMFLKIEKDENGADVVSIITTRMLEDGYNYYRYVDPLADWYRTLVLCAYNTETPDNYYTSDFPVEVSADMNTVTIKSLEQDGKIYSLGFATESYGYPNWSFPTTAEGIILTRTADKASTVKGTRSISKVTPKVSARSGNHFRRTRTPYDFVSRTPVQGKVFSVDNMRKNLKK